jgi:hypothetical protein
VKVAAIVAAVHFLRPADRDRDPVGPILCLGVVGHINDGKTAEVLLGLGEPVGEYRRKEPTNAAGRPVFESQAALLSYTGPDRPGCTVGDYCCSGGAQTQIPRMLTAQLVLGLGLGSVGDGEGEGELVPGDDGAVGAGLAE